MTKRDQQLIWEAYGDYPRTASGEEMKNILDQEFKRREDEANQIANGIRVEAEHADPETQAIINKLNESELAKIVKTVLDHLKEKANYYKK